MIFPRFLIFALSGILLFSSGYAQTDQTEWTLIREADNISLFTRDTPASVIDEAKAETIITGNVDSALLVLMDLDKFTSTDPYVKHAEVLHLNDSNDVYYYLVSDMPVFLKDRDYVIRMRKSKTAQGYFLVYEAIEGVKPPVDGLKRVTNVTSYISLQTQPGTQTFKMVYKVVFGQEEKLNENSMVVKTANKMIPQSTYDRLRALRKLLTDGAIVGE